MGKFAVYDDNFNVIDIILIEQADYDAKPEWLADLIGTRKVAPCATTQGAATIGGTYDQANNRFLDKKTDNNLVLNSNGLWEFPLELARTHAIENVNNQLHDTLLTTDYVFIRLSDNGTAIPAAIKAARDANRELARQAKVAISGASSLEQISAAILIAWV